MSNADSLEQIYISLSSEKLRSLRAPKMSFGEGPVGGGSLWCFSFGVFGRIWVVENVGEIFSGFERKACRFTVSKSVIKIVWLGLLVGVSCNWRRRCAMCGSGFEFSGSVIVGEREAKKMCIKRTGSVVGHNFKIEECLPQNLCVVGHHLN